jgi:hypothetical protein
MSSIQVLLILLSLLATIIASLTFRSKLGHRLVAGFLFMVATAFVTFPNVTTAIANKLGVGRGTDLLLYVSLFAGVHGFLLLYLRTRRIEQKIVEQIRAIAIRDAQQFSGTDIVKNEKAAQRI